MNKGFRVSSFNVSIVREFWNSENLTKKGFNVSNAVIFGTLKP